MMISSCRPSVLGLQSFSYFLEVVALGAVCSSTGPRDVVIRVINLVSLRIKIMNFFPLVCSLLSKFRLILVSVTEGCN